METPCVHFSLDFLQACGFKMFPMTKSCHFFKITFKRTRKHLPPDFIVLTVIPTRFACPPGRRIIKSSMLMSRTKCLCPEELLSGSRLSLPQVATLMLHFGWGQERISEVPLPAGLDQLSPEHPTVVCAHGLTPVLSSWIKQKAGRHFHIKEHKWCIIQTEKRHYPFLICVTLKLGQVEKHVKETWHLMGLFSSSVLRLDSRIFLLPKVREGGRTRLTFGVGFL